MTFVELYQIAHEMLELYCPNAAGHYKNQTARMMINTARYFTGATNKCLVEDYMRTLAEAFANGYDCKRFQ
jgi:hypothetical protein